MEIKDTFCIMNMTINITLYVQSFCLTRLTQIIETIKRTCH